MAVTSNVRDLEKIGQAQDRQRGADKGARVVHVLSTGICCSCGCELLRCYEKLVVQRRMKEVDLAAREMLSCCWFKLP